MKISVIGAGNVGALAAMRIAQDGLGEVMLIDVVKGMALGKAFDMEDSRAILKNNFNLTGSDDITQIKNSDIIVITAGLARKPGMTREELLCKNAQILKDVCGNIKVFAPQAVVIVVTNPLDMMTYFVLKSTGFKTNKVIGMGISLDSARFANLISKEMNVPVTDVDACVIASHGEGMLPLTRFSSIKGVSLDEFVDEKKKEELLAKTIGRGAEIVGLLGNGSAFFAPSSAIALIVRTIVKDEKRTIGVCAYLNGEYGVKGTAIGVPCRIGKNGIEQVVELELNKQEKELFQKAAEKIKEQYSNLPL